MHSCWESRGEHQESAAEGGRRGGRRTSPHLVAEPDQLRVAVGHQVQVAVLHLHGVDAPAEALVVRPRQPVRDSGGATCGCGEGEVRAGKAGGGGEWEAVLLLFFVRCGG